MIKNPLQYRQLHLLKKIENLDKKSQPIEFKPKLQQQPLANSQE